MIQGIKFNNRITTLTSGTGFFVLIFISLSWDTSRAAYVILGIFALLHLIATRPGFTKEQKIFCLPIVLFFLSVLASFIVNESPARGPQIIIETYSLLFFAIPLLHIYTKHSPPLSIVWAMFIAGAIVLGLDSIVDVWNRPGARAGGSTRQAVLFATMAISITTVALASFGYSFRFNRVAIIGSSMAVVLGFTAMMLSQSRGAWIAVPVILLLVMLFYLRKMNKVTKYITIPLALIILISASYQIPFVSKRIDIAVADTMHLLTTDRDINSRKNSVGYRVELWIAAIDIFNDNKVFGIGPDRYKPVMKTYVKDNNGLKRLPDLKHAHNQLLNTMMTKGVIGALVLIFMLGSHLYIFIKYLSTQYSPDTRTLALAGCLIITCYIILGLTSAPLDRKITLVFYSFSLSILLGKIISLNRNPDPQV